MTPSWILDIFAALMLAVAAVSAARLAVARAWQHGSVVTDTDIAHLLMAIAMAGMLVPDLTTLPRAVWEAIFTVMTAWFAYRVIQDARANGTRALAGGHCAPHLVHSAAMLYMFLALVAPASGSHEMSGMGGSSGMQSLDMPNPRVRVRAHPGRLHDLGSRPDLQQVPRRRGQGWNGAPVRRRGGGSCRRRRHRAIGRRVFWCRPVGGHDHCLSHRDGCDDGVHAAHHGLRTRADAEHAAHGSAGDGIPGFAHGRAQVRVGGERVGRDLDRACGHVDVHGGHPGELADLGPDSPGAVIAAHAGYEDDTGLHDAGFYRRGVPLRRTAGGEVHGGGESAVG